MSGVADRAAKERDGGVAIGMEFVKKIPNLIDRHVGTRVGGGPPPAF